VALPDAARSGVVATLGAGERRALEDLFRRLRRSAPDAARALRDALERSIAALVERLDPLAGDVAGRSPGTR
jgi:plasmid stabilization system protein ParE